MGNDKGIIQSVMTQGVLPTALQETGTNDRPHTGRTLYPRALPLTALSYRDSWELTPA